LRRVILLFLLLLATGCSQETPLLNENIKLLGEGVNWVVSGYEVKLTEENFKAGDGVVKRKGKEEYITDFVSYKTYAMINKKNELLHSASFSGSDIDVGSEVLGSIEGETYLNKDGTPIDRENISGFFMIVEWWE